MLPSFKLFGELIYVYPMLVGLAWGLGFFLSKSLAPKNVKKINFLIIALFGASWIGAKIFFLATSSNIDKIVFAKSSNFWLGGGFVFYGGLIFGFLVLFIFSRLTKQRLEKFFFLVIPLSIGHGIGRVGCFYAGCCHGSKVSNSFITHVPVQLFEALGLFIISFICYRGLKLKKNILFTYLISYGSLRFGLEFFRGDEIRGLYLYLSTSQWISIVMILLSLIWAYMISKGCSHLNIEKV